MRRAAADRDAGRPVDARPRRQAAAPDRRAARSAAPRLPTGRCAPDWGAIVARRARSSASRSPRLVGASACSSSRTTVSRSREQVGRVRVRQQQRHLLGRGEQDVGRADALARLAARSRCRRVRVSTRIGNCISCDGRHEVAGDVDRQRLQRRDIERVQMPAPAVGAAACDRPTRLGRKPASVLPAPVGAISRVERRAATCFDQRQLVRARLPAARGKPAAERLRQRGSGWAGAQQTRSTARCGESSAVRRLCSWPRIGRRKVLASYCKCGRLMSHGKSGASAARHRTWRRRAMDRRQLFGGSVAGTICPPGRCCRSSWASCSRRSASRLFNIV